MLTPAQVRRFQVHALGLDTPFASVEEALDHMRYVQIDPINVCGRMHDLILRNRVEDYRAGQLHEHIYGSPRGGFEHYLPGQGILVAFPLDAWPYIQPHLAARRISHGYSDGSREAELAKFILDEIRERGPLSSDEIEHDGRALGAWGTHSREAKIVLEQLFIQGRVLISARRKFRRIYDLPERVLPADILSKSSPSPIEADRHFAFRRLKQRRLARLSRKDRSLLKDDIAEVTVDGCPVLLHCAKADLPLIEKAQKHTPGGKPRLLAPLDPLIYDRRVTAAVWDFHYTWEVYTPPAKRIRGYYALPLLSADAIVGHVDPKADRKAGCLKVMNRKVGRGHRFVPAVNELAAFLGLKR